MIKPTFSKIILRDDKLVIVPDDYAERHELVRVTHPLLAQPLVFAAWMPEERLPWKEAVAAANARTVYGRAMRAPTVEELFMSVDRSVYPGTSAIFFPDIGDVTWSWSSTVDAEDPEDTDETARCAWVVYLRSGYSHRDSRSDHGLVRAVCASQYSDLGVVES